jgi:hypothetical protein
MALTSMKRLVAVLILSGMCFGQAWSGILAPERAIDWTTAGLAVDGYAPGTLPSSSYTQCVTTACQTVTTAGSSATNAQINSALSSAPSGTYVLLAAGTYNFSSGLTVANNQTVLRGSGANATFIVLTGHTSCNGFYSGVCMPGSNSSINPEQNWATWNNATVSGQTCTPSYAQGSTCITLSNSLNITAGSTLLTLDQQDEPNDTGQIWNCAIVLCSYGNTIVASTTATSGTNTTTIYCSTCNFSSVGTADYVINITRNQGFSHVASVVSSTEITLENAIASQTSGDTFMIAANIDGGGTRKDNTCSYTVSPYAGQCSQQQQILVTSCDGGCGQSGNTVIHLAEPLYMPNWRSSQSTGAFWPTTTIYRRGVEDLSVDVSGANGTDTIVAYNCYECWASGVRSIDAARNHVWFYESSHSVAQFNYFFEGQSHNTQSYAVEMFIGSSDNMILSNICEQQSDSCPTNNSGGSGNVSVYNTAIQDVYFSSGWFQPSDYDHASGHSFWLREGNEGTGGMADDVHGTHHFTTYFRNAYPGWQTVGCGSVNGGTCSGNTTPMILFTSYYFNIIGNVMGYPGYHTNYINLAPAGNQNASVIYTGGSHGGSFCTASSLSTSSCTTATTTTSYDARTQTSTMFWGNWDVVTNAVRYCTANATPISACTGDERADTFGDNTGAPSTYAALTSPSTTFPPSFFLSGNRTTSASPCGTGLSFWKNPTLGTCVPFPPIGPDVTGGNLGICPSGSTYAKSYATNISQCGGGSSLTIAYGGHANANPARICFLSVMGGNPDGSDTSALPFNRASCYANDPASSNTILSISGISGSGAQAQ